MTTLRDLDRLVGTWTVSGGATGTVTYAWLDGGHFLVQNIDLHQNGQHVTGIEIIGHHKPFGAEQAEEDVTSRFYGRDGDTLDYVYDLDGDTLTIWGGHRGSPAHYRATFDAEGTTLSGEWVWPGGSYRAIQTKVS
ncbi:hypothetical protein [Saccharomonospora xinjiangensis]|uniref:DUF1579 domain-containing protein n=1 Tax=Saccharomonospora xinjiangensis XJ-54 TaxID=882086 RepID=I0V8I7_9PSEU|nr:hypothetical protein [Saccharomonospora xinjiangensis]EID56440.1 hypothetical protein SacxiDRAFT_4259 [Saccharomonospora xinjiangensis XJ-54]